MRFHREEKREKQRNTKNSRKGKKQETKNTGGDFTEKKKRGMKPRQQARSERAGQEENEQRRWQAWDHVVMQEAEEQ